MRKPCLQCFRKHLGNAKVLLEELADGYPYWMDIIGHLDQAAQEIRKYSTDIAVLVRAHRIEMQKHSPDFFEYNFPFEASDLESNFRELPDEVYEGLSKNALGNYELYVGDQRY